MKQQQDVHDFKAQHDLTHALERGLRITPSRLEEGGGGGGIDLGSYKSCRDKFWEYLGPLNNFFWHFFFKAVGQHLHGQKWLNLKMLALLTKKNSFTGFLC